MTDPYCKAHHCPRSECRPVDTHVESIRVSDTLWDALTRKAEAQGTYRNDGIVQALTTLLTHPPDQLEAVPEKGLGPRKNRTFRVTVAQWDELATWAAKAGAEPSACVNAAILAWALPDFAVALRSTAEMAAAVPGTREPAATEKKPRAARTKPPVPASVPAPRQGKAPVVAELRGRIAAMEAPTAGTLTFLEPVPDAKPVVTMPVPKAAPCPPHPKRRVIKGFCGASGRPVGDGERIK